MKWLLFILTFSLSHIQKYEEPIKVIQVRNVDFFTLDQFGNLYLLSFNELSKIDADRKTILHYSNPLLGNITSLSALDPLELLLFYRDQSKIIILDNRLSEKHILSLQDFKLRDVQLVSQSDGNHLWVYEQATDKLYRINLRNQNITHQSLNIAQLLQQPHRPIQIETNLDEVYLNIPEKGIMVFDANGAFKKLIPILNISRFIHDDDYLYYIRNEKLFSFDITGNKEKSFEIDASGATSISVLKSKIFVLKKSTVEIYKL